MKKIRKKLTQDQRARGVIFSSTLSYDTTEHIEDTRHEVFQDDADKYEKIERLLDDKFFNKSPWKYNIVREL